MKPIFIFIIFAILFPVFVFGQAGTTQPVYKNLITKKFYQVQLDEETHGKTTVYKVNDSIVDKVAYDKFQTAVKNMGTCTPCLLETYNAEEKLLYRGVQYTDCRIGSWTEYFPNGKVKLAGQYKENDTHLWGNLYKRNLCSIMEGTWTYYDDQGKVTRVEKYKDGKLVQ